MLCNTAINIANIEGGKIAPTHTHNRKLFKMLDFVILDVSIQVRIHISQNNHHPKSKIGTPRFQNNYIAMTVALERGTGIGNDVITLHMLNSELPLPFHNLG